MTDLEKKFDGELSLIYDKVFAATKYPAHRFREKVKRWIADGRGGVAAAKDMIRKSGKNGPSEGFKRLADRGALNLSMEYLILRPEFAPLFTEEERQICRERLLEHGCDPDKD